MKYYLHRKYWFGIKGDLLEAVRAIHPFEYLNASDFEEITEDEYENTILDWRFENGEWQQ